MCPSSCSNVSTPRDILCRREFCPVGGGSGTSCLIVRAAVTDGSLTSGVRGQAGCAFPPLTVRAVGDCGKSFLGARQRTKCVYIISFNTHNNAGMDITMVPILQTKKLMLREPRHVSGQLSQDLRLSCRALFLRVMSPLPPCTGYCI